MLKNVFKPKIINLSLNNEEYLAVLVGAISCVYTREESAVPRMRSKPRRVQWWEKGEERLFSDPGSELPLGREKGKHDKCEDNRRHERKTTASRHYLSTA